MAFAWLCSGVGRALIDRAFRHCNIVMRGMELGDAHVHEISSSEVERFLVHSQHDLSFEVESLLDAERRSTNGTLSDAALEEARKIAGYNITQSGLLVDPDINAHRLALYDWPHTVFQDGAFKHELQLRLAACSAKLGSRRKCDFVVYLKGDFMFPKSRAVKMRQMHTICPTLGRS